MKEKICINGCRPWVFCENKIVLTGNSVEKTISKDDINIVMIKQGNTCNVINFELRMKEKFIGNKLENIGSDFIVNLIVKFSESPEEDDLLQVYYKDELIYDVSGKDINRYIDEVCYEIIDTKCIGRYIKIRGWIAGGSMVSMGIRYVDGDDGPIKLEYESFDAWDYHKHVFEASKGHNGFIIKLKKPRKPIKLVLVSDQKSSEEEIKL